MGEGKRPKRVLDPDLQRLVRISDRFRRLAQAKAWLAYELECASRDLNNLSDEMTVKHMNRKRNSDG